MKKVFSWAWNNILFIETLFLLMFIPLYPKLPLLDVKNTWVYIRAEDFVVLVVLISWVILLLKRKITLRTPLTLPIMIFWIIGAVSTIHGVILIFPTTANVFPNVAFLNFLRHMEYMSLFFIAYAGMRDKRFLPIVIAILAITLLFVVGYGIGQKYFGFPAYLTMNEEFAKGIPIQLSQLSRVPSTFAGHYDLAAYLVLIIPILASLVFGFRNWFVKIALVMTVCLGFGLLFMTVSRVSFFVLLLVLFGMLFFQKKRFVVFSLPFVAVFVFLFFSFQPTLLSRFGSTIKEVNVLVDAKTGEAIGHVTYVPVKYFEDKIIRQKRVRDKEQLDTAIIGKEEDLKESSPSAILPLELLDPQTQVPLVVATNVSTGESLPQGTGYINLSLSPVTKRLGNFFYELGPNLASTTSAEVLIFHGDFLVKRAAAYDLSFTTRFQGEWPRALEAFKRNILVGSGYGSVSLAVDNNYFRMLGEVGLLGIVSFFAIFLTLGIYIKRVLPDVDSPISRSFVLGFAAGVAGLALNAILIDVFEASKIAFLLWLLTGVTLGILKAYQTKNIDLVKAFKKAVTSTYALAFYLLIATIVIFSPVLPNYFVGDDFTWFRWVADSGGGAIETIGRYFSQADGFFYRPGTKTYFFLMYSVFWLNQTVYHVVSIFLHFIVAVLFFLLAKKILRDNLQASLASFLFLIISGYSEIVFWASSTGYLFNAVFALVSLLSFILWEEKKKVIYYITSVASIIFGLLFHELGVVIPLLLILYKFTRDESFTIGKIFKKIHYLILFLPVVLYLIARYAAQSHWSGGDYSYNLVKLPFNVAGNVIGYITLATVGPISLPFYQVLRNFMRENIPLAVFVTIVVGLVILFVYRILRKNFDENERRTIAFGFLFFFISLLPFLGLGNIASRYSYLASLGLMLLLAFFIKKLYNYLRSNGRDIALASIMTGISLFFLLHVIQVQEIRGDWHTAGDKAKRFFVSIDALYDDSWSRKTVEFHFVDVPIRHGAAWVFPVGLSDALWFTFRNDNLKVYIDPNLDFALDRAETSDSARVFQFQDDGSVKEIIRPKLIDNTPSVN